MDISNLNFVHLLDLTRSSCEKCVGITDCKLNSCI